MLKTKLIVLITCFALIICLSVTAIAEVQSSKNTIIISESETISEDLIAGAKSIQIDGTVEGNVYVAGETVTVNGMVNHNLYSVGGEVDIYGTINGDIVAFGGSINISEAIINGNIHIAGGQITLDKDTVVKGSFFVAGGTINTSAHVSGHVYAVGGEVKINGVVEKGIDAGTGMLTLGPSAQIDGDVTYVSNVKANINSNAQISGVTAQIEPKSSISSQLQFEKVTERVRTGTTILSFLWVLTTGCVFVYLTKIVLDRLITIIETKTALTFGIGVGFLILGIPLAITIVMTIIGLQVGLALLGLWILSIYVSKIVVGYLIGKLLLVNLGVQSANPYLKYAFGLLVLLLLTSLPYIGWVVYLLMMIFGMGTLVLGTKELITSLRNSSKDI